MAWQAMPLSLRLHTKSSAQSITCLKTKSKSTTLELHMATALGDDEDLEGGTVTVDGGAFGLAVPTEHGDGSGEGDGGDEDGNDELEPGSIVAVLLNRTPLVVVAAAAALF